MFKKESKTMTTKSVATPKVEKVVKEEVEVKTAKEEVVATNPSEVVVDGKLYRQVAFQADGPHSPTEFRLEEVK